jgi:putative oxidoreductase
MNREWVRDLALLALRLCGLGLALHGWDKAGALVTEGADARFVGGVARLGFPLPLLFAWAATASELAGGLLIAVGLFTRAAAAFAAFTMAVAAFVRHRLLQHVLVWLGMMSASPETVEGWGNPELAAVYCAGFLALALLGGGRWSIDRFLRRSRAGRR